MKHRFYKLIDLPSYGTIVRTNGASQQMFVKGEGWVDSGIMIRYFCDESDYYNLYEEISEQEALEATGGEPIE